MAAFRWNGWQESAVYAGVSVILTIRELHGVYSLVVASDVLEYIPDDKAAMRGIFDLLIDRGMGYKHTPGGNINAPLTDFDTKHGYVRHGYSEQQIKDVIYSQPFSELTYCRRFNKIESKVVVMPREGNDAEAREVLEQSPSTAAKGGRTCFCL